MNKEPIGLYIFRYLVGMGLFAFMCMLYWSSVLLEQDIKIVQNSLTEIKEGISNLKTSQEFHQALGQNSIPKGIPLQQNPPSQLDVSLPNILQEDPFYSVTLPHLLGPDFRPQGTRHMAGVGRPKNLHPFSNWNEVASWISSCSVAVSSLKFGIFETMSPDMAVKIEQRIRKDSNVPEFWIHLRDQVYWQPLNPGLFTENIHLAPHFLHKHQVTAHDFKFYYDAIMNPFVQEGGAVAMRNYLRDVESVEVIDNLTFIVRWKAYQVKQPDGTTKSLIPYNAKSITGDLRPLACFIYQYFPDGQKIIEEDQDPHTYLKNSVWAQNFSEHWARNIIPSCGPWIFEGMTERQIKFKRNPDYYFPLAALVMEQESTFKESADSVWEDFKTGKIDTYNLRPEQIVEWKQFSTSKEYQKQVENKNAIKQLEYLVRSYAYIGWNSAKPYFNSKNLRLAMTLAIDRHTIIKNILNGMGVEITGPFFIKSEANDSAITPWSFDLDRSKALLDEEGWRMGTNGVREKVIDGKKIPFSFNLTYFTKNPTSEAICSYISTSLKEVGVNCILSGVDISDLSSLFDDKSFDSICLGWTFGNPPDDPRQIWHSDGAKEKGSSNAVGFSNAEVDSLISALQFEDNLDKRIGFYHRIHQIIHDEAPYTFLYTPKTLLLYREYLQNVFIPADHQDLIPGANMEEPQPSIFWIRSKQ